MPKTLLILGLALALLGCDRIGKPSGIADAAWDEARQLEISPSKVEAAVLKAAASDRQTRQFYELRGWKAAWDRNSAAVLLDALNRAEAHALSRSMFVKIPKDAGATRTEAALTQAALEYASALAQGRIDPKSLFPVYSVPRPDPDLSGGLSTALAKGQLGQWLAALPPQTAEYRALSQAYLKFLRLAAHEGPAIADGQAIKVGTRDRRVPQLVDALRENSYLPAESGPETTTYTPAIAKAVMRLQADYGIEPDGVVGPDTLEVLNTSAVDKARQLAVNLERRRWLVRNPPATRIDVNTAATFLDYWRNGQLRDERRVVDGQPDWETPQLGSPIFQLVANPSWTVPKSIAEKEILPKGAGYMWENNMTTRDGWIVQLPGPENSLGLVKLDMRNKQSIYLHDTPAKPLFAENERHRSHGCVRVEEAVGFARMIASDDGTVMDFDDAMAGGEESFVKLKSEIPVRLLYHTAFVDNGGRVRLRTDAYGWDERVAVALGMAARAGHRFRSSLKDIGP